MKSALAVRRAIGSALVLWLVMLSGSALAAAPEQAPPVPPGQSRVWFLRQLLPGENLHPPMVYVNGAPIASIAEGTAFYRDFIPGQYVFNVENCLSQTASAQTMVLAANAQYALQVQQDDNGAWACTPPQVSYLRQVQPQQVPYLFSQVNYLGAR